MGLEKLTFLLKSSPRAQVLVLAPEILPATAELARKHGLEMLLEPYHSRHLKGKHLVIACTDDESVNQEVHRDCRERSILVNVADNPPYCDFYMGGIVTKGHVKVGISTNGKSPTTAKRLRQFFEEVIPEDIDELVRNLNAYRQGLKGSFQDKVQALNEVTKGLIDKRE